MRPILILDGNRYARTLAAGIASRVIQDLAPILRHIAREQDTLMTISEDILTEATSISDDATSLLAKANENSDAIDQAIALIESLEVDPAQQAQLDTVLTTLRSAGDNLTGAASELDASTTKLADITAAPEPPAQG